MHEFVVKAYYVGEDGEEVSIVSSPVSFTVKDIEGIETGEAPEIEITPITEPVDGDYVPINAKIVSESGTSIDGADLVYGPKGGSKTERGIYLNDDDGITYSLDTSILDDGIYEFYITVFYEDANGIQNIVNSKPETFTIRKTEDIVVSTIEITSPPAETVLVGTFRVEGHITPVPVSANFLDGLKYRLDYKEGSASPYTYFDNCGDSCTINPQDGTFEIGIDACNPAVSAITLSSDYDHDGNEATDDIVEMKTLDISSICGVIFGGNSGECFKYNGNCYACLDNNCYYINGDYGNGMCIESFDNPADADSNEYAAIKGDPSQCTSALIEISSPEDDDTVSGRVDFKGRVSAPPVMKDLKLVVDDSTDTDIIVAIDSTEYLDEHVHTYDAKIDTTGIVPDEDGYFEVCVIGTFDNSGNGEIIENEDCIELKMVGAEEDETIDSITVNDIESSGDIITIYAILPAEYNGFPLKKARVYYGADPGALFSGFGTQILADNTVSSSEFVCPGPVIDDFTSISGAVTGMQTGDSYCAGGIVNKVITINIGEREVSVNPDYAPHYYVAGIYDESIPGLPVILRKDIGTINELESGVEYDDDGNVVKADFVVEEGGNHEINGLIFEAPVNTRVKYSTEDGFEFPEGTKIKDVGDIEPGETVAVSGQNVHFLDRSVLDDELILDGEAYIEDEGYFINEGQATYGGMNIKMSTEYDHSSGFLIVRNFNSNPFSYSDKNWIRKMPGEFLGFEMQTTPSIDGLIRVEFLEDNEIFDVGKNGNLWMDIYFGDNVKVEDFFGIGAMINHTSGGGSTSIYNGDALFFFMKDDVTITPSIITVDRILSERFAYVPCLIISDVIPHEDIRIGSDGSVKRVYLRYELGEFSEESVYEMKSVMGNVLDYEDVQELVGSIKKNVNSGYADDTFRIALDVMEPAIEYGFDKDLAIDLITNIIDLTKDDAYLVLDVISGTLYYEWHECKSGCLKGKVSPEQFSDFTLEVIKNHATSQPHYILRNSYPILPVVMGSLKLDFERTKDFTITLIGELDGYDGLLNCPELIEDGLNDFNGGGIEEIIWGLKIAYRYGIPSILTSEEVFDLNYPDIRNKKDLAVQFSDAINKYFDGRYIFPSVTRQISSSINMVYDTEHTLDASDEIRKTIIDGLSFKSMYYMTVYAFDPETSYYHLYTSTFEGFYEKMRRDFPNLYEEMEKADPYEIGWMEFTTTLASRGKLEEVYNENRPFYRDIIQKSLVYPADSTYDELSNIVTLVQDTIKEIYDEPDKFGGESEKVLWEDFFIENYKIAEGNDEEAIYAYLLALNDNPLNEEIREVVKGMSVQPITFFPGEWSENFEIAGKLYFYSDENWFGIARSDFNKTYKMDIILPDDKKNVRLVKNNVGGKKLVIDMELVPHGTVPESFLESVTGDYYNYVALRGHYFNTYEVIIPFLSVELKDDDGKISAIERVFILHDGGCGCFRSLGEWEKYFPSAFLVADKNTGKGFVNDKVAFSILESIAKGETDIRKILVQFEAEGMSSPSGLERFSNKYIIH